MTQHTHTLAEYHTNMRTALSKLLEKGDLFADLHILTAQLDYAEAHGLYLGAPRTANLWGFGEVPVLFVNPQGGFWVNLIWLIDPTGLTYSQLIEAFLEEEADEDFQASVGRIPDKDGKTSLIVDHSFVMRTFSTRSPWHREFYEATRELIAHALERSGLLDQMADTPTGFTAVAHMENTTGKAFKVSMPVHGWTTDGTTPIVQAPWDDAPEDDLIPITDLCRTWELHRSGDAARAFLGPRVDEETAIQRALAGPALDPTSED